MVGLPARNFYFSSCADLVLSQVIASEGTANDERATSTQHSSLFLNVLIYLSRQARWWTQRKICTHLHWSVRVWYLNGIELRGVGTDRVLCSFTVLCTQSGDTVAFTQPVILFLTVWSPIPSCSPWSLCGCPLALISGDCLPTLPSVLLSSFLGGVASYCPLDSVLLYHVFLSGLPAISFMPYFIYLK